MQDNPRFYTGEAQKLETILNKLGFVTYPEYQVGKYFIDIFCPELGIGFEFDGPYHKLSKRRDQVRDAEIEEKGIKMIRVVKEELSIKKIKEKLGYDLFEEGSD